MSRLSHIDLALVQPDWSRFMSSDGLAEKSGTSPENFRRMILKELADNAADSGDASLDVTSPDEVMIEDAGPGIDAADLAEMFSIKRPLVSTKHWRMGRRGALGNGLRAVMGGLYVLGGHLVVRSRGTELRVSLNDQGDTVVQTIGPADNTGTEIRVFCSDISSVADFASIAVRIGGRVLSGSRPSPFWFDADAIRDLQRSAEGVSVRDFVAQFGTRYRPDNKAAMVNEIPAQELLNAMQAQAKRAPTILPIGADAFADYYAKRTGPAVLGDVEVPACIEVWATSADSWYEPAQLILNRTRALADAEVQAVAKGRVRATLGSRTFGFPTKDRDRITLKQSVPVAFTIAISAPFFPIVSSGKAPDFRPFALDVLYAVVKAGRAAQAGIKRRTKRGGLTIKDAVYLLLPDAYDRVSDGGWYHANA